MRIIAFTDIHGSYRTVEQVLAREFFDAVVIGGDLTTGGTSSEAEEAIQKFQATGKQVIAVAGNMDPPELEETFTQLGVSVNGRGIILNAVGFFGVSAAPFSPLHTPYEISEEEILKRAEAGLKDVQGARSRIFIPHSPPKKTRVDKIFLGTHVGSSSVRAFIERHQPNVAICGHIHEARGQDSIGKTQIINCGPAGRGYYGIIEIGEKIIVRNCG